MHGSPSCHRPADAACAKSDADRPANASLEVSLASLRRLPVAPYRPEQPAPDHPASALFPTSAPTPGGRLARAVFSASRLRCLSIARLGDAVRAGHSWPISFDRRTGPAPGTVLATWPGPSKSRRRPWDSLTPFAVLLPSTGDDACSDVSHPPAVSPRATASFIVAGSSACGVDHRLVAAAPGVWPRGRTVPCDLPAPL
jgi:hypothetical protein